MGLLLCAGLLKFKFAVPPFCAGANPSDWVVFAVETRSMKMKLKREAAEAAAGKLMETRPTKRAKSEEQQEILPKQKQKEIEQQQKQKQKIEQKEIEQQQKQKQKIEQQQEKKDILQKVKKEIEIEQKQQQKPQQKENIKKILLEVEGISVDLEDPWFNNFDLNELVSLYNGLVESIERGQGKEFWEKAKFAGVKAKAAGDPATEALALAFQAPFVDPQEALRMLLDRLDVKQQCASTSTTPCASVIQSSGTGKSRSLVELSSLGVCVCYCSLQTKSGFPLRTGQLADALVIEDKGEDYYRGYLKAWLEVLYMYLSGELKLASPPSSSSDPPSACKQWILEHCLMKREQVSVVIDAVNEQWVLQRACTVIQASNAFSKVHPLLPRRQGVGILFVFDEAAQLFSHGAGNNIRRAFLSFLNSTFGVFVDTCSNVSVLAPSLDKDPSQRVHAGKLTIPPPVWEISNVDVLAEDLKSFENVEDLTLQRLFKYGRPLWASCMSSIAEEIGKGSQANEIDETIMARAMEETQALARRKLCGGVQEDALQSIREGGALLDVTTALAILGARLVIDVNPLSSLATNLVASHLSYVLDISDGNRCITSSEPWDPIITHVAKDMFAWQGFRDTALGYLQNCLENHWIDEGKAGELVGRYILVRAMDTVKKGRFVTLGDFLCMLVGDKQSDTQALRQGLINFSGFVPVMGYTLDLEDLLRAFILEKAFICKTNQERFDALIPVLLPEQDGSFLLKPKNMSILGMQFKSINGNRDMTFDASIWMSPEGAGIGGWQSEQPFTTVLMQLGFPGEGYVQHVLNDKPVTRADTEKAEAKDQPTTSFIQQKAQVPSIKQLSFVVYGLTGVYQFLEENERKLLQELIQCRRHRLMVSSVKEFAQTVMPLSFKPRHY